MDPRPRQANRSNRSGSGWCGFDRNGSDMPLGSETGWPRLAAFPPLPPTSQPLATASFQNPLAPEIRNRPALPISEPNRFKLIKSRLGGSSWLAVRLAGLAPKVLNQNADPNQNQTRSESERVGRSGDPVLKWSDGRSDVVRSSEVERRDPRWGWGSTNGSRRIVLDPALHQTRNLPVSEVALGLLKTLIKELLRGK